MPEVVGLSHRNLSHFPLVKKHIFQWLGGLSETEANSSRDEIRKAQGKFLKSARHWRNHDFSDMEKISGISKEKIQSYEDSNEPIQASDWFAICSSLNIQADAETFFLLLEGAFSEAKKKSRIEISDTMWRKGYGQLKAIESFHKTPSNGATVIPFKKGQSVRQ